MLLGITGIVFVGLRFKQYGDEIDLAEFGVAVWAGIAVFGVIYGAANVLLGLAWWNLLGHFGANLTQAKALRIYGLSQLAKYVPGNIFHFAGRQAMGMAAGAGGWPLVKSAVWEVSLLSLSGLLLVVWVLPLIGQGVWTGWSVISFFGLVAAVATILKRYAGLLVMRAFGWYVGFLTVSGVLFVGVVELTTPEASLGPEMWMTLVGAYAAAWLAGLVTPGAPAGVGVREMILLALLQSHISESGLLLAVVFGRLVTVTGDALMYGTASLVRERA